MIRGPALTIHRFCRAHEDHAPTLGRQQRLHMGQPLEAGARSQGRDEKTFRSNRVPGPAAGAGLRPVGWSEASRRDDQPRGRASFTVRLRPSTA